MGSDQPIYTLKKKRVDHLSEGQTARMQEDELDSDDDSDDGRPGKKNKKKKKQGKQGNLSSTKVSVFVRRSNIIVDAAVDMGSFRNKSYNAAKATGSKKKGKGEDEEQ